MSQMDREFDRQENLRIYVAAILREKHAIIPCPSCGANEITSDNEIAVAKSISKIVAACKLGAVDATPSEAREAVAEILSDTGFECLDCEPEPDE